MTPRTTWRTFAAALALVTLWSAVRYRDLAGQLAANQRVMSARLSEPAARGEDASRRVARAVEANEELFETNLHIVDARRIVLASGVTSAVCAVGCLAAGWRRAAAARR